MWSDDVAARTLWQEARGEPHEGQVAVACVLNNRLKTGRWGKSLASVCLWRGQFSGWYVPSDPNFAAACSLLDDDAVLTELSAIIKSVMSGEQVDITNGATHYFALSITEPAWAQEATFCGQFGHQKYYKGVK